jgi:hypothetical protein
MEGHQPTKNRSISSSVQILLTMLLKQGEVPKTFGIQAIEYMH